MTAPTRDGRPGESQALPVSTDASQPVTPALIADLAGQAEVVAYPKRLMDGIAADLGARTAIGVERYGTPLQTHNGRNVTLDAYEEVLDLAQYLKQRCMEQPRSGRHKNSYWLALSIVFTLKEDLDAMSATEVQGA